MRLIGSFLACAFLLSATTTQVFMGGIIAPGTLTPGSATFAAINGSAAFATAIATTCSIVPTPGNFDTFKVNLNATPGGGAKTYTFAVWKATSNPPSGGADTALTTAALNASGVASASGGPIHFNAGDYICLHITPSGTPTAVEASWSMQFTPDTSGETMYMGGLSSASSLLFISLSLPNITNATENQVLTINATPGTVTKLVMQATTASGAGKSLIGTVSKNTVASSMTVTSANSTALQSTTSNSFSVAGGDDLDIALTITGSGLTPSDLYVGIVIVPTTAGQFTLPMTRANAGFNNAADTFAFVSPRQGSQQSTRAPAQQVSCCAMTVQAIYAYSVSDLGNTKTYTFTLEDNASASSLNTVITGTGGGGPNTNGTTGGSVSVAASDLLDTLEHPGGTPTVPTILHTSYLGYIAPTGGVTPKVKIRTLGGKLEWSPWGLWELVREAAGL